MNVLVVDDSKVTALVLKDILEGFGYEVEAVPSATKALDAMSRADDYSGPGLGKFDLVMTGLMLRDMDGIKFIGKLKADEHTKDVPVIVITAKSDDESLLDSFKAGAADFISKSFNRVELQARTASLMKLKQEMDARKDFSIKLEEANKQLTLLATMDGLTGIPNRRSFDDFLEREWGLGKREDYSVGIVLMDIDCFKLYNDNYGHQKGDAVLKNVAQALASVLKRPGDQVARYGGEEFVMVLGNTEEDGAMLVAERARAAVEALAMPHGFSLATSLITISVGVACDTPLEGMEAPPLIQKADEAMYVSKKSGRNMVTLYGT